MKTLEQAKEIIAKVNDRYNMVTEYENAFLFWVDEEGDEIIGSPDTPKAVMKDTGEVKSMAQIVIMGVGEEISESEVVLSKNGRKNDG